jgi:hypothetical protein
MPEEYEMNEIEKTVYERLLKEPNNFSWTPSLSTPPLTRDQLLEAIKKGEDAGKEYIKRIVEGTISRLKREM